jgi:hypothetical protein
MEQENELRAQLGGNRWKSITLDERWMCPSDWGHPLAENVLYGLPGRGAICGVSGSYPGNAHEIGGRGSRLLHRQIGGPSALENLRSEIDSRVAGAGSESGKGPGRVETFFVPQ